MTISDAINYMAKFKLMNVGVPKELYTSPCTGVKDQLNAIKSMVTQF